MRWRETTSRSPDERTAPAAVTRFDFGENWSRFSDRALDGTRVAQARADFAALMRHAGVELANRSFLDIGFGQGLGLLSAAALGARAIGCDIDPKCAQVLERNRRHFPELAGRTVPVEIGSILDAALLARLRVQSPGENGYDVVHSWGVLHHTGSMWQALDHAAGLVAPDGVLIVALYNRHWSSPLWKTIKRTYCASPAPVRRAMIAALYPVIAAAKAAVTRRNPFATDRGMDFYHDVVDWVGGYPYEVASPDEVSARLARRHFALRWQAAATVPTGCNEQVFVRRR